MQYGFYFDEGRCIACSACVFACKDWNEEQPETGVYWRRVTTEESGKCPNVRLSSMSLSCLHCEKPACQPVCQGGAISKRAEDGIVVVDRAKCLGCRSCAKACPFGAPQFGADGTMQMCNFCLAKVQQGGQPECAMACTGRALFAGPMPELARLAATRGGVRMAGDTLPSMWVLKAR
jgi:Fe-S-cluster-containing dehydrogenase component